MPYSASTLHRLILPVSVAPPVAPCLVIKLDTPDRVVDYPHLIHIVIHNLAPAVIRWRSGNTGRGGNWLRVRAIGAGQGYRLRVRRLLNRGRA